MLFSDSTPKNGGLILWADSFYWQELYELCSKLWDSAYINDESFKDYLYWLSYDIRKAYEGAAKQVEINDCRDKKIFLYGFETNWVLILIQVAFIRYCMAYVDTSKKEQGIIYLFEYQLELRLQEQFSQNAKRILEVTYSLVGADQAELKKKIANRSNYFLGLTKVKRTRQLLFVMQSLSPMSSFNEIFGEEAWEIDNKPL